MADYQLTQTGNEVQTILNTVGDGKFVWLDSVDTALYDAIPQAKASWFAGYYDTSWTNRPTDYGLIYMMTVGNAGVQWAYEYAIAVGGEEGQMYVRTTNNGVPWSSWKKVVEEDFRYISVTPNTTYIRSDANAVTCSILNGVAYVTGLFIMEANVPANEALLYSAFPKPRDSRIIYCSVASNSGTAHRLKVDANGQLLTDGTTPLSVASWYSLCISYPTND